jgi:three-Cys-motif partner protein
MVEKTYDWENGAILGEHSRRKHKILGEYFFDYLTVRCQLPQREKFRLAIVDGFSGGGRYDCGTAGSPLIFLEELTRATETVNIKRALQGLGAIDIECLVVLNDIKAAAVEKLKTNVAPILEGIAQNVRRLHVRVEYLNEKFENAYPKIKELLSQGRYRNVIFNLDQCGHSHVHRSTLVDIMRSYQSAEIFYTFAISALLAFLRKSDPLQLAMQLAPFGLGNADLISLEGIMTDNARLGAAERIVFDAYKTCAPFVSPFSIHNPVGWR